MRVAVTIMAAAMGFWAGAAEAQVAQGRYGGGLIEYLMTGGGAPGRPAPMRAAAREDDRLQHNPYEDTGARFASADPMAGARQERAMAPPTRLAALPSDPAAEGAGIGRALDPRFARQVVPYQGGGRPGSIVIDTSERFLYLVQPGGQAIRYGIGVGRPGFLWTGTKTISAKKEWPDWTPPAEMMARRPDLPSHMEGGPGNPLGARAMYLGSSLYRIHGTNEPHTIGQAVSSGCIRMMNEDVIDLYERTPVGTRVDVI